MNKQLKQQMFLIFFGVALFAALTNLNEVAGFFRVLAGILSPVVSGLLLAFVLSVPMLGIARRLMAHFPKMKEKTVDALSLTLTMLCVAVLVFLLCVLAIPQLAASVRSIAVLVRENWPDWVALLSNYGVDTTELTKLAASFDWKTAVEKLFTGAGAVIGSVVDLASSTVSVTVNAVFAIVIMFYVLLGRRELGKQSRGFLYAYCKETTADRICRIAKLTHDTYAKFFSGQCIEVLILGTLIFLAFSAFRIPYAALTAVLTAAFAFIPYIGAFASCLIGVLLTLLAAPEKAILCFLVYQAGAVYRKSVHLPARGRRQRGTFPAVDTAGCTARRKAVRHHRYRVLHPAGGSDLTAFAGGYRAPTRHTRSRPRGDKAIIKRSATLKWSIFLYKLGIVSCKAFQRRGI